MLGKQILGKLILKAFCNLPSEGLQWTLYIISPLYPVLNKIYLLLGRVQTEKTRDYQTV